MYKLVTLLTILISSLLLISCGEDNNGSKEKICDPACNNWETCVDGHCKITEEGACNKSEDCINVGDICKNNKCITPASCNEWETYVESTNSCVLTPGRCLDVSNCNEREYCSASKECKRYPAVNWSTNCPSYLSTNAECATIKLPLDYNSNDGKTVDTFVFRHKAISGNSKGQIWFLQGGPGGSGAIFSKYYFDQYTQKYPDYDFYSLDHRGVANSSRLSCSQEDNMTGELALFRQCTEELANNLGDNLLQYSTTNAAKDVGFLMEMFKKPNKKRFLYGVSYGTYWAERYLTIFPNQADGIILDSICTLKNCYMDDYSKWTDLVGHQFLDVCKDDATCNEKMNSINPGSNQTPQESMMSVLNKIDSHPCDFGYGPFKKADAQAFLTTMLMNFYARMLIPPVIYRLNRCEARDKAALAKLIQSLYGMRGKKLDSFFVTEDEMNNNTILYYNIVFGELWYGRTQEEITEVFNNSLFNTGDGLDMYNMKNSGHWHEYGDQGYLNKLPNTTTPVLMMNGTLDPQTALEIALPSKEFLNKEHQYFLTFPQTPHGIIGSSYTNEMLQNYGQGTSCGEKIMFEWIANPTQEPSTDCFNDMYQLSWSSRLLNGMGAMYMGTSDVWDGSPSKSITGNSKLKKAVEESMEKTYIEYKKYPEIIKFIKNLK